MRISEDTAAKLRLTDRTFWISIVCFCEAGVLVTSVATGPGDLGPLVGSGLFAVFGLGFLHNTL
jgi:hypothetical protein